MIEIEIAFVYFDEMITDRTEELQKIIQLYKDNYLVYYIFCNNYCIFSNIEITKIEAETLVKFLESDKGIDMLYGEGIQTDYAKYAMFKPIEEQHKDNDTDNKVFEKSLENYVQNVKTIDKISELKKINALNIEKIEKLQADNNITLESKELLIEYQKLLKEKDKKIHELQESNIAINKNLEKIPRFIRSIFIKNNKLLN